MAKDMDLKHNNNNTDMMLFEINVNYMNGMLSAILNEF